MLGFASLTPIYALSWYGFESRSDDGTAELTLAHHKGSCDLQLAAQGAPVNDTATTASCAGQRRADDDGGQHLTHAASVPLS